MKKNKHLQKIVRGLVKASFKDGKVVESKLGKSIKILKSLPKSEAISALSDFLKEIKRREREHTLLIETTVPLSSVQIKKVKKIVEKKVNPSTTLRVNGERSRTIKISKVLVSINPQILGGFKLKVGDGIWDESILGKMSQVRTCIARADYEV